ncbi:dimethylamine monooxygenase subunit DmmA family protein [Pseudarthrobacter sp. SSS035]|uniref:dimethylamine monooxygenase subunit DmmA family protein n=1 Tax=Pseudarthrobacter sp. SSS035 TaxID=2931399 RepID=UPI00273A6A1F|nr:dimethylamine monooxygenase subunit DmmA family protein [Pseudarthrobacter sp. SSS035]
MCSASRRPVAGTGCEPGFRGVICASFGSTDAPADQNNGGRPRHDLRFSSADQGTLSNLRSVLGRSCIGVRLVLAGPAVDVHAAAAAAAECGLLDEEMTLLCEEGGPRLVFCGHCRTATITDQPSGSEVDCQGCTIALAISSHFSRRIGGYLGFSAHAEEAAA